MTDTTCDPKPTQHCLDPCEQEIFAFARQIGVACAICLLVGGTGVIATSSQASWDIARSFYLALVAIGPVGILIAQRFLRILMKHTHKDLSIFDQV